MITLLLVAFAASVDVPPPLEPWIPWALHGHEAQTCSFAHGDTAKKRCAWPGKLELDLNKTGGSFRQVWTVEIPFDAQLPGDDKRWPLDISVDGKPAAVIGAPTVRLTPGTHVISGKFAWDALPESLPIPARTAAVKLVVEGREIAFVDRGDDGAAVWLKREASVGEREEDRLDIAVFRKITDGVPLLVETRVLLEVAGKGREVTLPGAMLDGFSPLSLTASLPARVDGTSLKVQVRPGRHTITLIARRDQDVREVMAPSTSMGGEGSEEVWVYAADTAVRVATIGGVPSIVAEQTRLPDEWRGLPAYRVLPGEKVTLDQKRRGDESPAPSQLSLQRVLWLDFDGDGYTVQDHISGRFTGDRLAMAPGTDLGRVSTGHGGDAFITTVNGGAIGVEVRNPALNVVADARIENASSTIPATSWAHDFQSVAITLHLPPGYSLWHAAGVDEVFTTWVKSWTLFELFLVVILTIAMFRLWGPVVGVAALLCTVLTFQEGGAPRGLWVTVVVLAALARVLPAAYEARAIGKILRITRFGTAIVVALVALGFAIDQVRVGMYPVLAQEHTSIGSEQTYRGYDGSVTKVPQGAFEQIEEGKAELRQQVAQSVSLDRYGYDDGNQKALSGKKRKNLSQIDPTSVVQTGPGLPRWGFKNVTLKFSGPVKSDQTISLVLLGPRTNFALALLRVLLMGFLVVVAFGMPGPLWPSAIVRAFRGKGALFGGATLSALVFASNANAEEVSPPPAPPANVLDELRVRLLAPPPCAPTCASIPRIRLDAGDQSLRVRLEVHAAARTAVPLPGADKQWTANSVIVDGKSDAAAAREDGVLWIALEAGRHDVVLEGPLPRREAVQIALPLVPKKAAFASTSWTLDGIREDGVPDANLQLARTSRGEATGADQQEVVLPAFLLVERTLLLGLSFEVETRVVRLSPTGNAVVLEIPLLPGESVTTDGVRVQSGKALVGLGPTDNEVRWSGVLPTVDKIALKAPQGVSWIEQWNLETSPVWHVEESGIPPLHDDTPRENGARAWRPWPGEALALTIQRPTGVPGRTLTIDSSTQTVRPGLRSTDVDLTLSMRASRGGQHVIALPQGAELLSATINGSQQPLRPDDKGKVQIPVLPGAQTLTLETRTSAGIAGMFENPVFDAGDKSVNAELIVQVPSDRWILFATGPRAGPAVLFWSFLVVIIVSALALSRVPISPLRAHQWVLLSLGLTQVPIVVAALVAGWLLMLGWRKKALDLHPALFNLRQIMIVCWTIGALIGLAASIHEGLLGSPDMQIAGNGSSDNHLRWFADHADGALPQAVVVTAPIAAYRIAMLAWSLWLALALLGWLKSGWGAFSEGGLWRNIPRPPPKNPKPATSATPAAPEIPGAPTSAAVPDTQR